MFASTPATQGLAAVLCGGFVSFSLGLVGGGGSILAVPLILYVVGLHNPHVAIGTAALAVAANAYLNMVPHARAGHVRWGPAFAFAASGVLGAAVGSSLGKLVDGQRLLVYFAFLMCVVAVLMLRVNPTPAPASATSIRPPSQYPQLCGTGLGAGSLSGFFGIGGGFLVVPGLMFAGRMRIVDAIGTSLFAVGSFGLTTAVNYARSGQVDWLIAIEFISGGIIGGWLGTNAAGRLAKKRGALNLVFSSMIFAVAAYMLYHAWLAR
ncbi:sulfite exporter TauE/SafE family protein [Caballeronia sp. LZ032]|uniref:sulfite exporter TauE/SafE family protein n=1 Tax=Caballeronia sp. LZ032 TaxID=3038565 RepID=UPI0028609B3F|nr:sulfite exporter TauE/SafE family protein [Caballeronia sp. LZ032]MDR5880468.1 sulfite exporter TauE/SafE family protein [Caballeronia sp. LZ032]